MANGQPRPAFYVAVFLVILGLVGLAVWRFGTTRPSGGEGQFSSEELKQLAGNAEKPDSSGITTVKEYNYVPTAKLPEVKGISNYTPIADQRDFQIHADGGSNGTLRDQRVGRLGPHHLRQQRLQGRKGLEDSWRQRLQ